MDRDELPCCNFNCNQGRFCLRRKEAAEACTEIGADTKLPPAKTSIWLYVFDFGIACVITFLVLILIYALGVALHK